MLEVKPFKSLFRHYIVAQINWPSIPTTAKPPVGYTFAKDNNTNV